MKNGESDLSWAQLEGERERNERPDEEKWRKMKAIMFLTFQ